jgi:hypothetical protein
MCQGRVPLVARDVSQCTEIGGGGQCGASSTLPPSSDCHVRSQLSVSRAQWRAQRRKPPELRRIGWTVSTQFGYLLEKVAAMHVAALPCSHRSLS